MIYLTSDIHGKKDCLEKLLDYVHFNDGEENNFLFILGDVIDRNNNGGVDILKWLLSSPQMDLPVIDKTIFTICLKGNFRVRENPYLDFLHII